MYTAKEVNGKRVIKGKYVPVGFSCLCKECSFTIEVPKCTTDEQIKELVDKITGR